MYHCDKDTGKSLDCLETILFTEFTWIKSIWRKREIELESECFKPGIQHIVVSGKIFGITLVGPKFQVKNTI